MINDGDIVVAHYNIKMSDGDLVDSSNDDNPFRFVMGSDDVLPIIQKNLLGASIGDSIEFIAEPKDAHGERNDNLILRIDRNKVRNDIKIGDIIKPVGQSDISAVVLDMTDDSILVDANHPFAGVELTFSFNILDIQKK
jgi:FKBP-type peptidyl-prolyl cis-trans isomerase 2